MNARVRTRIEHSDILHQLTRIEGRKRDKRIIRAILDEKEDDPSIAVGAMKMLGLGYLDEPDFLPRDLAVDVICKELLAAHITPKTFVLLRLRRDSTLYTQRLPKILPTVPDMSEMWIVHELIKALLSFVRTVPLELYENVKGQRWWQLTNDEPWERFALFAFVVLPSYGVSMDSILRGVRALLSFAVMDGAVEETFERAVVEPLRQHWRRANWTLWENPYFKDVSCERWRRVEGHVLGGVADFTDREQHLPLSSSLLLDVAHLLRKADIDRGCYFWISFSLGGAFPDRDNVVVGEDHAYCWPTNKIRDYEKDEKVEIYSLTKVTDILQRDSLADTDFQGTTLYIAPKVDVWVVGEAIRTMKLWADKRYKPKPRYRDAYGNPVEEYEVERSDLNLPTDVLTSIDQHILGGLAGCPGYDFVPRRGVVRELFLKDGRDKANSTIRNRLYSVDETLAIWLSDDDTPLIRIKGGRETMDINPCTKDTAILEALILAVYIENVTDYRYGFNVPTNDRYEWVEPYFRWQNRATCRGGDRILKELGVEGYPLSPGSLFTVCAVDAIMAGKIAKGDEIDEVLGEPNLFLGLFILFKRVTGSFSFRKFLLLMRGVMFLTHGPRLCNDISARIGPSCLAYKVRMNDDDVKRIVDGVNGKALNSTVREWAGHRITIPLTKCPSHLIIEEDVEYAVKRFLVEDYVEDDLVGNFSLTI